MPKNGQGPFFHATDQGIRPMNKRHHPLTLSSTTLWLLAEALFAALHRINKKLEFIMALVSIEQDDLDSIANTVSTVADDLQAVLDSETPLSPADETALNAAVAKLQALDTTPAAPAPDAG